MMNIQRSFTTLAIISILGACATKPVTQIQNTDVKKVMSVDEVRTVSVKADDYKNYIFERTVKVRVANDPSSAILVQIDEGSRINAFIQDMNNGWSYFKNKTGVEGYFFGKSAKEVTK
jgi:hypothetical protein